MRIHSHVRSDGNHVMFEHADLQISPKTEIATSQDVVFISVPRKAYPKRKLTVSILLINFGKVAYSARYAGASRFFRPNL